MDLGLDQASAQRYLGLVRILTSQRAWYDDINQGKVKSSKVQTQSQTLRLLERLLSDDEVQRFLLVNRYQGELWFNKEAYEELVWWMYIIAVIRMGARAGLDVGAGKLSLSQGLSEEIEHCYKVIQALVKAEENSGYQVNRLLGVAKT